MGDNSAPSRPRIRPLTAPQAPPRQLFLGTFIYSKTLDQLEYLHDAAVCVDASGRIAAVARDCDQAKAEATLYPGLGWDRLPDADPPVQVQRARGPGQFFFPGFVDTHLHAPQYPNAGIFGKTTLLDWLHRYTFPMEASLGASPAKARRVYERCVRRTLAHGSTTVAYYATVDVPATNLLADLCLGLGQRALVGRVCMDDVRTSPDYYVDASPAAAEAATRASIAHIRAIDPAGALVRPVLTPRFAPSCTVATLTRLGALARDDPGLPIQTHIAENRDEIRLVRAFFPDSPHYAAVYDRFGLLTPRTILAHAVHLSEAEADLVALRGAGVAHCPCSNSALASGEARVRWLLDKHVPVGLGTDVSGGYAPSLLEAARLASLVSRHHAMPGHDGDDGDEKERDRVKLSVDEVLYLATRGGAAVVGLGDRLGAFEVGMEWDAQLISLGLVPDDDGDDEDGDGDGDGADAAGHDVSNPDKGNVDIFGREPWDERVAKWLYNGDDRNTSKVWVRGRLVHARP